MFVYRSICLVYEHLILNQTIGPSVSALSTQNGSSWHQRSVISPATCSFNPEVQEIENDRKWDLLHAKPRSLSCGFSVCPEHPVYILIHWLSIPWGLLFHIFQFLRTYAGLVLSLAKLLPVFPGQRYVRDHKYHNQCGKRNTSLDFPPKNAQSPATHPLSRISDLQLYWFPGFLPGLANFYRLKISGKKNTAVDAAAANISESWYLGFLLHAILELFVCLFLITSLY